MSRYLHGDEVKFEYKGYQYKPWDDVEEDNVKRFHYVYFVDEAIGKAVNDCWIPLSPYTTPSFELFKNWIDMGKPTRNDMGGHHAEHHEAYYVKWVTEQLEKELDL